jgi:hypothetical protein
MLVGKHDERGDSLIEIVMSIVLIGLVVGAYFFAFSTGAATSTAHQDLVTADAILRDYAESIKAAVQDSTNGCGVTNPTTFTASYTPPAGFTVTSTPSVTDQACPPKTSVKPERLTVTLPNGRTQILDIEVRTP